MRTVGQSAFGLAAIEKRVVLKRWRTSYIGQAEVVVFRGVKLAMAGGGRGSADVDVQAIALVYSEVNALKTYKTFALEQRTVLIT